MRLKSVLLLAFYFVGIHCFHHKNNNENKELAEKAKQILSGIGHVGDKNINTLLEYVKNLENFALMVELPSKVQDAASELYQPYKEEYKDIKPIKNEELNNQTFLNEILGNLLESFKDGNDVDGKTMSNAISIWKYFISTFEIPSTAECTCDLKTNGKATRSHSFPKMTPIRRKRENGCPTAKRHRCVIASAVGLVVAVVLFVILVAKGVIHIHIPLVNN
uniref:Uncharacterized protein n=3 Tax=Meloidogyne TaxID=189290 RepID=A0A6V7UEW5_MELEN|nr:unnamed protein product [Meloidogyne enterolobii]CAD2204619.1 unnamed protein product [Meloidogyne enterolobii]